MLISSFLVACKPGTAYYTYQPVSSQGWERTDTLLFELPDSLHAGSYELGIGVRHMGKYPYRDLWLEMTQLVPTNDVKQKRNAWKEKRDTIHLYLADEKGNWMGSGNTSGHFQLLSPCGQFILPEDSISLKINQQEDIMESAQKKKKYTFLGQTKVNGLKSKYQLRVVHIMTDSILPYISDIGLRLQK